MSKEHSKASLLILIHHTPFVNSQPYVRCTLYSFNFIYTLNLNFTRLFSVEIAFISYNYPILLCIKAYFLAKRKPNKKPTNFNVLVNQWLLVAEEISSFQGFLYFFLILINQKLRCRNGLHIYHWKYRSRNC